jgi:hypothetical protein
MLVDLSQSVKSFVFELQAQVANEIATRSQQDSLSDLAYIKAFENISHRLTKIGNILKINRYNLVFIGQVGTGKTTAISHLFGLTREVSKVVSTDRTRSARKSLTQVKELLSTGSGKTTICEVVILPSGQTSIQIEPYGVDEVKQLIDDFGLWIWQKAYPTELKQKVAIPPNELLRAIRNILSLPELMLEGKLQDKAVQFAMSFSSDRYLDFQQQLIECAHLSTRSQVAIKPPENTDLKLWVSETFQALNVAKLPSFSIPKRIYLSLDSSILNLSKHPRLGAIVDTRGLDATTKDRRDLEYYIRKKDNCICIFTDRFATAPDNSIQIVGKYLTATSKDLASKFSLLVMPRKGEPEKILGADGLAVEDYEAGVALRKANIDNVFLNENINFPSENIIFYDALQAYLDDGTLNPYYDREDVEAGRNPFFADIERLITNRERELIEEVRLIQQQFDRLRSGQDLNKEELSIITTAKDKIKSIANLDLNLDLNLNNFTLDLNLNDFSHNYIDSLASLHHMVLRATNNRYGRYELRDVDIYFNGKYLAEQTIRDRTITYHHEIVTTIEWVESSIGENSSLHPLMQRFRSQTDENYERLAIDLGTEVEALLADRIFAPQDYDENQFWQQVINRWGQGPGFKKTVISHYQDKIAEVNSHLESLIQSAWRERIIKPIFTFLGD